MREGKVTLTRFTENLAVLGFPYKFVSRQQMQVPFTVEQFFDVFRDYNDAVWPAQLFLLEPVMDLYFEP